MIFLCPECRGSLEQRDGNKLVCRQCGDVPAEVDNGLIRFSGCTDQHHFFEKQALERLNRYYEGFDDDAFARMLSKRNLWEMDLANKKVGTARKFWWEDHLGRLENKQILDVGAGVNYITPYFLKSGNRVTAFDICEESIAYQHDLLKRLNLPLENLTHAVADVEVVEFDTTFDIINMTNMLHHVTDKKSALMRLHRALKDDGRLLLVEPNYYYPPRWAIETDVLDAINFVKKYFVRNDLIEKGEKAVIFSDLVAMLEDVGFRVEYRQKDWNYLGYFTVYWMDEGTRLARAIYWLDTNVLRHVIPRVLAPFEYLILAKA